MTASNVTIERVQPVLAAATVIGQQRLCREHYRITLRVPSLPAARPGQFVQLSALADADRADDVVVVGATVPDEDVGAPAQSVPLPFLPRAFSIGGLRAGSDGVEVDVIYRVVGLGTRWLESLRAGARVRLLGPLGQPFPILPKPRHAHLVIGGVGLPPLLWFAEALQQAGKSTVALAGAQSADLLPLVLDPAQVPGTDGSASLCARDFAERGAAVVISTDDGSCGVAGNVVDALARHDALTGVSTDDCVVYTCGPERMMRATAGWCAERGMRCYVCMERAMACGLGTCQSCVVPVRREDNAEGQRYALCCTEGPVFDATSVVWET